MQRLAMLRTTFPLLIQQECYNRKRRPEAVRKLPAPRHSRREDAAGTRLRRQVEECRSREKDRGRGRQRSREAAGVLCIRQAMSLPTGAHRLRKNRFAKADIGGWLFAEERICPRPSP